MNRKIILAVAAAAALFSPPAAADYWIKDGNGVLQQIRSGTVAGKILPYMAPVDTAGAAFGTVANPFAFQFGTGILLPNFAQPQHFICDAGCSGGGGGGGSVFGPTAVGSPAANPPVLIGGTIDGTATGNMSAWKVLAGVGFINCANCSGSGISVAYGGAIGSVGTPGGFKDGSGNFQPFLGDVTNGQWVNIKASIALPVTGTFFQATQPVSIAAPVAVTGSFFQATQPISASALPLPTGAATAANQTSVIGTASNGTAATNSLLAGGQYNSTPLTLTNLQQSALQLDASGFLKVNVVLGGGGSATFGATFPSSGVALGVSQGGNLVAVTGTGGNLNVQCANCSGSGVSTVDKASFVASTSLFAGGGGFFQTTPTTNPLTTGQQGMFQLTAQRALFSNLRDSSGTELGVSAAPLQVSLANTAANGTALLVTGSGGTFPVTGPLTDTQLRASAVPVSLTSTTITGTVAATQSGTWNITNISGTISLPTGAATAAKQPALGTAGAASTDVLTVQGIASMTPLLTNPGTAANWGVNTLGSTTAGQSGQLALCAVTTAAPSYTTAQSNALSCGLAGALRVDGSGFTQPVSLTSTTITGTVAVTQSGAWSLSANQSVNVSQINGVTPLMGNGVTGTGSQRVTIASDNTAFTVNAAQSGTWNVTNISGTISLPTGAATAANQATMITSLATIATNSAGANPLNVNTVVTAQTGLTPGATTSAQTGTIVAANVDLSSQLGVALGAPTAYGTAPTGRALSANAFVTNFGTGTAGSAAGGIVTVQGVASMTPLAGNITQVLGAAISATNGLFSNCLLGNAACATGTGAQGATSQRVTVATDQATNAGAALVKGGVGTVNGGSTYNTVAASQTNQILSSTQAGGTGTTGDYLSHCVIQPSTTGAGTVTILDNATTIFTFTTGTLSNLASIPIPIGAVSVSGGWKVTTGANEIVTCFGKFT